MCKPKPAARCSSDAQATLDITGEASQRAADALTQARATGADPDRITELTRARRVADQAHAAAQEEFNTTPAGISALTAAAEYRPTDKGARRALHTATNLRWRRQQATAFYNSDASEGLATNTVTHLEGLSSQARHDLAVEPTTPGSTLTWLARHGDDSVREDVASNPNTPPDTLSHLALLDRPSLSRKVAGNPGAAPDTLDHLSHSADDRTRLAVSSHSMVMPHTLSRMADDPITVVRARVARRTPHAEVLEALRNDDEALVRSHAEANTTCSKTWQAEEQMVHA